VTPIDAVPAERAIAKSCVVSPIMTVRCSDMASAPVISCSIAGCGFGCVSSAHRDAAKNMPRPVAAERSRPRRLLPVATASTAPDPVSSTSSSRMPLKRTISCSIAM
jgi:hypothetical protein